MVELDDDIEDGQFWGEWYEANPDWGKQPEEEKDDISDNGTPAGEM